MTADERAWARSLYERSVLKREKLQHLRLGIGGRCDGMRCLDIGGDNGVASLILRDLGGDWHSVEADETAADAVRSVVGDDVITLDDIATRFAAESFDLVVVVDMLEHVANDAGLVADLARVLREDGTLVVNVPRIVPGSPIPKVRRWAGLTDERHGHVRPGYTESGLRRLLRSEFEPEETWHYSRFVLESVDLVLNAGRLWLRKMRGERTEPTSRKGSLVTQEELSSGSAAFRALGRVAPVLEGLARIDRVLDADRGHRMVMRAARRSG